MAKKSKKRTRNKKIPPLVTQYAQGIQKARIEPLKARECPSQGASISGM